MRILFLTQVLPYPLDAGPKVRAYYVARYLAEKGHEVSLLSFVRETDGAEALDHLRGFCCGVYPVSIKRSRLKDAGVLLKSLPGDTPFLISRDWVPAMAQTVRDLVRQLKPGAVQADQLWMAPYALLARSDSALSGPSLILDQHNAVFQIPKRLADAEKNPLKRSILLREAAKMTRYEMRVCRKFDQVVWVTEEDRAALHSRSSEDNGFRRETVIPICVDPGRTPTIHPKQAARRVTFLGGLHWPPNSSGILWFLREIWPEVENQSPNAVLTVIGKDPPRELLRASERSARIEVTGYVEDPSSYLEETAVFIIPLRAGGGMRVKILDAWMWGLPVVTTGIGAEGIRIEDGRNLLCADTAPGFSQAVLQVLQKRDLASRLSRLGRRTVEDLYDWRQVYRAWDKVYECVSSM